MTKKILAMAVAILTMAGVAAAQPQGRPGDMNKMRQPRAFTEFAFEGILLSPEQQTAINAINDEMMAACPMAQQQCDQAGKQCDQAGKKCDKQCDKAGKKCDKADKKCDRQCDKAGKKCDKADKKCDRQCDKAQNCDSTACDKVGKQCDMRGRQGHMGRPGRAPQGHMMRSPRPCPEYVQKVKEVLTPEQYVTFLENIVLMPQPQE